MNDRHILRQKICTNMIVKIIQNVCKGYGVSFSVSTQKGGYIRANGDVVHEDSVALKLIGVPEDSELEIAKDLCCF